AVLEVARGSSWSYRGLNGRDRFHLYLTASRTGFRAGELATLTVESFDLDSAPPTATLGAGDTKSKKRVIKQPLPPDLVAALRGYLAGRPAGQPVWSGGWSERAAEMLKHDLEEAGIAYRVEGPDGPLYNDFHGLRHAYITSLEQAGVSPK